ncbi:MAG: hypothetical protein KAH35_07725, partial [Candidatus Atribacteria bacterium]|nr:hypothetical protein [Candidatus Atribacteria bacterium]
MKDKKKIIIFNLLIILLISFFVGCTGNMPTPIIDPETPINPNELINSKITIENEAETTKDCLPVLTISSEGAAYMSFSGDGNNWTNWLPYNSSYEEFNIANGLYGTIFGSGEKNVYIRFKDFEGNIFPIDIIPFDSIQYEMQDLHFLKIIPRNVNVSIGENHFFTLHGYDLGGRNEVPLEGLKVTWTKCCGVGKLSPTIGLSTTYTAP